MFEIENHGLKHKPCSVNGRSVYGIKGTESVGEVVDEIEKNAKRIEELTGRKPKYYRSGTAYYDDVCVEVAQALGCEIVNFNIIGDGGATFSKDQIKKTILGAQPGSIIILHMNQPSAHGKIRGETAEGIEEIIPEIIKRGYSFVRLSDYGVH